MSSDISILDYTCRARWPFRAFAQESLKTVTSPTSYRKYPQKGPSWSSQDAHFLVHFYFHQNQIALSIWGGTSFPPPFLRSIGHFTAILHISGSKKWSKQMATDTGRTHTERTDAHQKFEASCTKALKGKNESRTLTLH